MINLKTENIELRPEHKLILHCSHTNVSDELKEKISSLCDLELDWDYIIDFSTPHRLRPILYYNLNSICPDKVPKDVLNGLKTFYQENIRKNLLFTSELIQIMELLESNEIKAFTYKGPVLASMAYGNIGLREFGDIDIFINESDALKVKEMMLNNEYKLYPELNFKNDSYQLKFVREYCFINENNHAIIEIKWNFQGDFFTLPENPVLTKTQEFTLDSFNIRTLAPENQILVLCIHTAKHDWKRLSWLCDIAESIDKIEDINWNALINSSKNLGVYKILIINILLAKDLFGLKIPATFQDKANLDYNTEKTIFKIKKTIFINQKNSLNIFEKFSFDMEKRENSIYKLKDCFNNFTKPTYRDFDDLPLPERLFPLYHVIRPFLLLKRYGKKPL